MSGAGPAPSGATRAELVRAGRRLSVFTVAWNVVEGVVAVTAGAMAGSVALIGFGIDSFVETSSGAVMLWRFHPGRDAADDQRAEARALRLVGVSLLLLALYVVWEAGSTLLRGERPHPSTPGIVVAALSLVVMPLLARRKRRVAAELGSRALAADSVQTSACMFLSAFLLGGLVLNAALGWWWADPLAAFAMVPIIVREGTEALRGKACDDCCP